MLLVKSDTPAPLDRLTNLAPIYLSEAEDNHTELYFFVKLTYPFLATQPDLFQMVFVLYDRQHQPDKEPIRVISCGTLPVSADAKAHIAELTGISEADHPDVHRGDGYGGPPCNLATAANAVYTVTFDGARMVSINRDGTLPPEIADAELYDFDVSLYDLLQVAAVALQDMDSVDPALITRLISTKLG